METAVLLVLIVSAIFFGWWYQMGRPKTVTIDGKKFVVGSRVCWNTPSPEDNQLRETQLGKAYIDRINSDGTVQVAVNMGSGDIRFFDDVRPEYLSAAKPEDEHVESRIYQGGNGPRAA